MNLTSASHYTFGDNNVAAQRLERLAEAYSESTETFLRQFTPTVISKAVDLGSGLGFSTRLLQKVTAARTVIGYERSPRYLDAARGRFPELLFKNVDVLEPEFPDQEIDLIYSRFLLTHLHQPERTVACCIRHLTPGGRLLLEELSDLRSSIASLQTYYRLVGEMQTHYGQELYVGRRLHAIVEQARGCFVSSQQTPITLPAQTMARLHSMNIATWKSDTFMRASYGVPHLEQLEEELQGIASCTDDLAPVTCLMAQVVAERQAAA